MRRRTEGGIECGYSGIVTAASLEEFVTAIVKYARLYSCPRVLEREDKLIHVIVMTWEYNHYFVPPLPVVAWILITGDFCGPLCTPRD